MYMPALENFKEKLKKRELVFGSTFGTVNNLYFPRLFQSLGTDFMLFDFEHGNFMPETAVDMLQMCRACDLPTICRVQDCEYHCISKCIDMGADSVLIPRTETLAQVKLAIDSIRIYPQGRKGVGGIGMLRSGESIDEFNDNRLLFIQTESPLGVKNLPEILQVYGSEIAGVIIGPSDLSVMSGVQLNIHSEITKSQIRQIITVCQQYKKSVGMFMMPEQMQEWADAGMNMLWVSSDTGFMAQGLTDTLEKVKALKVQ